jgi:cell division protein FtsN
VTMNLPARGGFLLGVVAGLLIGLALALGVALYITKAPIPFINKVPQRTSEQDRAETERNRNWDPNAALGGKAQTKPASAATSAGAATADAVPAPAAAAPVAAAAAASRPAARDPAAILSGGPTPAPGAEPFVYFVQAGAYTRAEDAEQQRAKLALLGQAAKVSEREQAGRVVFRVRIGPFTARDEADALKTKLQESALETQIVRVEKP